MATTIEKLLLLQDKDRRIKQLTRESEDIPARRKLSESRLLEHRQALATAQDDLKKNAAAIKGVELDIETSRQRIIKFREQQNAVRTNEEYRALEREVASVEKQIKDHEDREILLMEETDGLRANVARMEQRLKQEEELVKSDAGVLEQRLGSLKDEIGRLEAERAAMLPEIDADWLSRYQRVFNHTKDYALVSVEGGSCGGCHMKLPPQVIQDVKKSISMVSCSFCGRILYWQP